MNLLTKACFGLLVAATALAEDDVGGDCSNIAEIACGTEGFETLCTAVTAAGLGDTLIGDGPFTVFAPNNEAFGNLPEGTVEALLADVPALTNVLLFHAVVGKAIYSTDLHCTALTEMANGRDSRTICQRVAQKIYQKGAGNSRDKMPEIIAADVEACNGVIHVVSEVMLP